jgi:hypothetical protein
MIAVALLPLAWRGPSYPHAIVRGDANKTEWDVYRLSLEFQRDIAERVPPDRSLGFWYDGRETDWLNSVQATFLWGYSRVMPPEGPGMPELTSEIAASVLQREYLVLLATTREELAAGEAALCSLGAPYERIALIDRTTETRNLSYSLVRRIDAGPCLAQEAGRTVRHSDGLPSIALSIVASSARVGVSRVSEGGVQPSASDERPSGKSMR